MDRLAEFSSSMSWPPRAPDIAKTRWAWDEKATRRVIGEQQSILSPGEMRELTGTEVALDPGTDAQGEHSTVPPPGKMFDHKFGEDANFS